jgi:hypothetical protein
MKRTITLLRKVLVITYTRSRHDEISGPGTQMPVPDDVRVAYFPVFPTTVCSLPPPLRTRNPAELLLAGLNISQDHPQYLL